MLYLWLENSCQHYNIRFSSIHRCLCGGKKYRTHIFQAGLHSIPFSRKKKINFFWPCLGMSGMLQVPALSLALLPAAWPILCCRAVTRVKSARGDWSSWMGSSAGCSPTYLGEKSGIDLFCGNVKLAANRKISLKLPKMPFAAIVGFFKNIFLNNSFP